MGLLAVSFLGFSSCRPSIAFSPKGVAALSSPSILAARFIKMLPVTGCPLGISGKSLLNRGPSNRENRAMTPPCSPILMIPSQRERTPVSPNEISKAVLEELKVELIISGNTCVSPRKTSHINAVTKAIRKKAIQMQFRTISLVLLVITRTKVVNLFVFELEKIQFSYFYFQSLFEHDSKIV